MGKLEIIDDCLSPSKYIYMHYEGPNSFKFASGVAKVLSPIFKITTSAWNEEEMKWDTAKQDHASYFFQWEINKSPNLGNPSSAIKFFIKIQGEETLSTTMGRFTMELTARVKHTFTLPNHLDRFMKPIWTTYSYLYYDRRRQQMLEICRTFTFAFKNWSRDKLGIKGIEVQ